MQVNKDNIRKNSKIAYHDYKVGDKVMIVNNSAFKYETPYNGQFEITQCLEQWNGIITVWGGKIRYNIRHIKPYISDTNVEDIKC